VINYHHKAIECHEQALVIAHEVGDRLLEGQALANLGAAHMSRRATFPGGSIAGRKKKPMLHIDGDELRRVLGDANQAIEYYEKARTIFREIGDANAVASQSFLMAILCNEIRSI